jgi:PIN domain nuclease of toxin-antitoxin system
MHLLLDTCALLWVAGEPDRLSRRARERLAQPDVKLYVSSISAFEISLKSRKGKLQLPIAPREWFREAVSVFKIQEIPVTSEVASLAPNLPVSVADPCDRMILATAEILGIAVVTSDRHFRDYGAVEVIW